MGIFDFFKTKKNNCLTTTNTETAQEQEKSLMVLLNDNLKARERKTMNTKARKYRRPQAVSCLTYRKRSRYG